MPAAGHRVAGGADASVDRRTLTRPGQELLAFGRELEAAGAAQVGSSFSGDPSADLVLAQPNAFLIGVLFTQGIPAERAWRGPWELRHRLGTLDLDYIAEHPDEVLEAVQRPPMLHRFKNMLPRWIVSAARRLSEEYGGDASNIWPAGAHVGDVIDRLTEFDGIGRKKAVMAAEILVRHFGVALQGRECGQIAYDVQVRRVFMRAGLAAEDNREAMEAAAASICPESPGIVDLPAWIVGRQWCRPTEPDCEQCRLGSVCPRLIHLKVEGVGARPRGAR